VSRATNAELDRLFAYHERTKHSWASVRAGPHGLDWDNQPNPFRTYDGVERVEFARGGELKAVGTRAALIGGAGSSGSAANSAASVPFDRESLGRILWYSLAISRWKQVRGTEFRYSLRVNPSSGNLHPTECHVALPRCGGDLEAGLFHYRALDHRFERRGRGDAIGALLAAANVAPIPETRALVAFTSIFWREAWKYRSRAYRYCLLDLGHALVSLAAAAATFGLRASALGWFDDEAVARALAIEGGDERPLLLVRLDAVNGSATSASARESSGPLVHSGGTPNRLSEDENHHPLLLGMHQSTELEAPLPECPKPAPRAPSSSSESSSEPGAIAIDLDEMAAAHAALADESLAVTTRRRRSAIDHDPDRSTMTRAEFAALLAALRSDVGDEWRADWRGNLNGGPGEHFVFLYIYVHRVSGLSPGLYRFEPERGLLQLRTGDFRAQAARLSLEQTLAGNATFAVSMVGDLERAASTFGCRAYRFVYTEAGVFGQRLYLAAESLGFQSTGIGAFYDDEVHRFLGLEGRARQVVYHFAAGHAAVDDRLLDVDGPVE
jgi:SagB-type dehydrogenase family enzyme